MANSSSQREKQILQQVQEHGSVSIKDLAESLDVSAMTIHRDLNRLASEGRVAKIHGEATLPVKASQTGAHDCAMCGKAVSERTGYTVITSNRKMHYACCAHCGLMMHERTEGLWQSMTADFLHGHMISANHAFYVLQSELKVCCVPSVLSFESRQEAEKFTKGFGGQVADMKTTIHRLHSMTHSK